MFEVRVDNLLLDVSVFRNSTDADEAVSESACTASCGTSGGAEGVRGCAIAKALTAHQGSVLSELITPGL